MREYLLVMVIAGAVTFAATPLVRWLALRLGAMTPVRERDVHSIPIPRLGGVGMLAGFAAAVLLASRLPYLSRTFASDEVRGVLIAAVIITVLGAVDDIRNLDWMIKLAGQVVAGVVMAVHGVQLISLPIGGQTVLPAPVLVVLTILVVVVSTNAVNFVDGLDGLAAGIVGISATVFFVWTYLVSHTFNPPNVFTTATFFTAALLGVCVGFLPHNFHPARLFMGDAGALLLGLLLAAAIISMTGNIDARSSVEGAGSVATLLLPVLLPVAIMTLPLLDMALAVFRRLLAGQSPFQADAHHLHHRMLRAGHTHRRAVLLLYLWAAVAAGGAVSFLFVPTEVALVLCVLGVISAVALTAVLPRVQRARRARG